MNRIVAAVAVTVMLFAVPSLAGSIKDLDQKRDFRGVVFGSDFKPGPEWTLFVPQDDGPFSMWERAGDKLSVGDVSLFKIAYLVRKGKVIGVGLVAMGENADKLRDLFRSLYGNQSEFDIVDGSLSYTWMGSRLSANVNYTVNLNGPNLAIGTYMLSSSLVEIGEESEKEKTKDL